ADSAPPQTKNPTPNPKTIPRKKPPQTPNNPHHKKKKKKKKPQKNKTTQNNHKVNTTKSITSLAQRKTRKQPPTPKNQHQTK
ncbi:hypothetical protein, partial [Rhizobium leguminosarum]|uniref:hypothetical protein n=1 Tax=Rhizobium leguminosarum TaxID=384 RepID=UPI003D03D4C9